MGTAYLHGHKVRQSYHCASCASITPQDPHLYEQAIQNYGEAIRLEPQVGEGYHYRGLAYEEMGKTKEAERDFAKAKELGYEP